ncbi:hypothetical protein PR001_g16630 [Phytophthora rubi]|uniref:Uncharacterized protein n=1 Tax=Phytophthora rubi TaxID=129364 RepID=A0A6A3KNA0_9STRA|nr:hypothetical protein PR001_g16630 [Phytophthora rubi]
MLAWTTALALNGSCQAPLRSCQSARACSRSSASVPLLPRKGVTALRSQSAASGGRALSIPV